MMKFISCCLAVFLATHVPFAQTRTCTQACRTQDPTTSFCGLLGSGPCTLTRYYTCYKCCEGWTGSSCTSALCHGSLTCPNGGSCSSPDYCSGCNRGYYSPRCAECTGISNCLEVRCSSSRDQTCDRCRGQYDSRFGSAYKPSTDGRQCIKQCSWRADSNACYPGSCRDSRCSCSLGFSGTDCRTMGSSQIPVIWSHRATLIKGTTTLSSPTLQNNTATVFTNVRDFTHIKISWNSSYQASGLPARPAYIHSVKLGVVSAKARAVVYRNGRRHKSFPQRSCLRNGTKDSPATGDLVCEETLSIRHSKWRPKSGDRLKWKVFSTSGGILTLYNRDYFSSLMTRYYSGREAQSAFSTFTFDFDKPYHCASVVVGRCNTTMLSAGTDVTSEANLTVTWQGWADDLSGIEGYALQVRRLRPVNGSELQETADGQAVFNETADSGQNISLPESGVYSVVLSIADRVGNTRRSRRFVFFDEGPNSVTALNNSALRVSSASKRTNFVWVRRLGSRGNTTSVRLKWRNHFISARHHKNGWLKPIGPYADGNITSDYDQYFGVRGRAEIPNVLGIVQFRVKYAIDHSGGRTIENVSDANSSTWRNENLRTEASYQMAIADGDSIRFWVEARDIFGHFARDSLLVHADSSPPVVEGVWLVQEGEVVHAVSTAADLQNSCVYFRIFDIDSGLRNISWRVFGNHKHGQIELARGKIEPIEADKDIVDCSNSTDCYCNPLGNCYMAVYGFTPRFGAGTNAPDVFIKVRATNFARLEAIREFKVSVGPSPSNASVAGDEILGSIYPWHLQPFGNELSCWQIVSESDSGNMGILIVGLGASVLGAGIIALGVFLYRHKKGKKQGTNLLERRCQAGDADTGDYLVPGDPSGQQLARRRGKSESSTGFIKTPNDIPLKVLTPTVIEEEISASTFSKTGGAEGGVYGNVGPNLAFSRDRLIIGKELGQGEFGRVLLATAIGIEEKGKRTKVAVKTLKDNADANTKRGLLQELDLMIKVGFHPNVVRLLGHCIEKDPYYVIVEYLGKGDLKKVLTTFRGGSAGKGRAKVLGSDKSLPMTLIRCARDVANGMAFLSSQKCVHRDLAARNVLVGEDLVCKVSDFGLARDVMNIRIYQRESESVLPLRWMAPESLFDNVHTTESDVWSYGVLLWEIVTLGARPYPNMDSKMLISQLKQGYRMPKPQNCEAQIYTMMHSCWQTNPKKRPAFRRMCRELNDILAGNKNSISFDRLDESIYQNVAIGGAEEKL